MDLILWRHAEAFDLDDAAEDLERALTSRGERHAARMATWLGQHLPATTRVLASPARRCQQTAAALDRKFKSLDALRPDGTAAALLGAARWPDSREPVLVIGHQPALGLVAAYLLSGQAQPWSVKKGAVWWLRRREREGHAQTVLVTVRGAENI